MTCVICNQFSDEPLCDSCRLLVEQSTFRHRFSSRCPVCGRPVEDSAYPCRWCSDHLGGFTDAYGPVSSLVSRFQNGRERHLARLLADLVREDLPFHPTLVPLPTPKAIIKKTGYDPVNVVASMLSKGSLRFSSPYPSDSLLFCVSTSVTEAKRVQRLIPLPLYAIVLAS
jgi:predicted amidophosphoribosyltransferase